MYMNLMLTMILGGLWHGANWTFIIWGSIHGIALCIHKFAKKWGGRKRGYFRSIVCIIETNIFVCLCWIFFRAESVSTAFVIIKRIFFFSRGINHIYSWTFISLAIMVISYICARIHTEDHESCSGYYKILDLSKISSLVILFVVLGLTIGLAYTNSNPFIYFQF